MAARGCLLDALTFAHPERRWTTGCAKWPPDAYTPAPPPALPRRHSELPRDQPSSKWRRRRYRVAKVQMKTVAEEDGENADPQAVPLTPWVTVRPKSGRAPLSRVDGSGTQPAAVGPLAAPFAAPQPPKNELRRSRRMIKLARLPSNGTLDNLASDSPDDDSPATRRCTKRERRTGVLSLTEVAKDVSSLAAVTAGPDASPDECARDTSPPNTDGFTSSLAGLPGAYARESAVVAPPMFGDDEGTGGSDEVVDTRCDSRLSEATIRPAREDDSIETSAHVGDTCPDLDADLGDNLGDHLDHLDACADVVAVAPVGLAY